MLLMNSKYHQASPRAAYSYVPDEPANARSRVRYQARNISSNDKVRKVPGMPLYFKSE